MSLSENPNPGQSRVLDEVRAKIFYLASDVEPSSQPAAMLLRAVAESIGDASEGNASEGNAPEAADPFNGHAMSVAALGYPRISGIRSSAHPARDAMPLPERHAGADSSRSGHKR